MISIEDTYWDELLIEAPEDFKRMFKQVARNLLNPEIPDESIREQLEVLRSRTSYMVCLLIPFVHLLEQAAEHRPPVLNSMLRIMLANYKGQGLKH